MSRNLEQLQADAQSVVEETLAALPLPVRQRAASLPVTYDARPQQWLLDDGYDSDLLGLFVGSAIAEAEDCPLPPQIILFIENIWDFAEEDSEIFREEIRTTYLHELGHYLGLDEIDLEERGLD
ncbi:MAG: metallopeptidase family protein [Verrucomicrobia bacterium]|nr:metallopeptidase family protein [Verrucomicrobiota bacterium]